MTNEISPITIVGANSEANKSGGSDRTYNNYLEKQMEGLDIFEEFMNRMRESLNCRQVLESYQTLYNLRKYKITEIPESSVIPMYQHIVEKFYKNHNPGESGTWVENQLRLFLWTIICYMELYRKSYAALQKNDWDFFAKIFYVKEYSLFEYQTRTLLDQSARLAKWTDQQDFMLYNIIIRDRRAKWNEIAKTLFVNSNKKYLRASKQCRQRWLNHLDPSKSKSQWSLKQYLILFEHVQEKGKKWALLVKVLNDRRSEHSIKNKYNSIIRKQYRLTPELNQKQACQELIKKINRIIETHTIENNDQYLFGCSLKLVNTEGSFKNDGMKKFSKNSPEEIEGYKNRFESFRKKIEKFSCEQPRLVTYHHHEPQNKQIKPPIFTKQKFTPVQCLPLQKRENQKKVVVQQEPEDQIFYDESFEAQDILRPQYNNALFTEDLKNFINEHELDV